MMRLYHFIVRLNHLVMNSISLAQLHLQFDFVLS
jgi:hypothetical protein